MSLLTFYRKVSSIIPLWVLLRVYIRLILLIFNRNIGSFYIDIITFVKLIYKYQWTLRVRFAQRTGLIQFPPIQRIRLIRLGPYATPRFLVLMIAKTYKKPKYISTHHWRKTIFVFFSTFSLVWFIHGLQIRQVFLSLFCLSVYTEI